MASFSVNGSQLPADIIISSGGTRRYGAKIWDSNETQSREISCHHGLATFRSEISPLRFASVEMTGVRCIVFCNLSLGMTVCCPPTSSSRAGGPAGMGQRFWALLKRRAERSPATMGLPHFGVRFLHSASLRSKWRGCGASFGSICPSVNDCMLPAGIVISSGGTRRYGAKILGSNETQSREISCHHGLATFRSEISPLRADRRNDGGGVISVLFMHFFTAPFSGSAHDSLSSPGGDFRAGMFHHGFPAEFSVIAFSS